MNALDVILFVFFALLVFYLVIVAATEPHYTWRDIATLEEIMQELQDRVDRMFEHIGAALLPILSRCVDSVDEIMSEYDRKS